MSAAESDTGNESRGGRVTAALRRDTVGGALLMVAAAVALVWANSPWAEAYEHMRTLVVGPGLTLEAWASDGLLAVFFFIVGNELKQEFVHGEFRSPRRALVPIVAAVSGVLVPAGIFALVNLGDADALRGWGVPMATDAAFAVAVLAVIGRHLPSALRTALLTLAVVDDLVAIVVIAIFYTQTVNFAAFAAAAVLLGVFGYLQRGRGLAARLNRSRLPNAVVYVPLAVAIWALVYASGIHATIAGVAMGLLMRTRPHAGEALDPSHRAENRLRPWAMGGALPVFALFSAGVSFSGGIALFTEPVTLGVIAGLAVGKLIGITGAAWLTTKFTAAELDPTLSWTDFLGMAQLAGVGFTVSLLISDLSYPDHPALLDQAKGGVLLGSVLSAVLATAILGVRNNHYRRRDPA